jgi:acetolactate synthase-1/2/3 large subunit
LLVLEFVPRQGISNIELQSFRKCLSNWSSDPDLEPTWQDQPVSQLFDIIRGPLCDKAITVTDTGNHQILARKYLHAREPRSLIVPTDFQSMGFGLSAAIGAAIARPDRRIFAIIGDGSFLITGAELGTAVRQKTRIIILLFRDGYLGQIRDQQLKSYGSDFATELPSFDVRSYVESFGAKYIYATPDALHNTVTTSCENRPVIVDIELRPGIAVSLQTRSALRKAKLRQLLGPRFTQVAKRIRSRE